MKDRIYKIDIAYIILKNMEADSRKITVPECAICLENLVDCVIVPCGHTVCLLCSLKITICHVCRQPINNRTRFYL